MNMHMHLKSQFPPPQFAMDLLDLFETEKSDRVIEFDRSLRGIMGSHPGGEYEPGSKKTFNLDYGKGVSSSRAPQGSDSRDQRGYVSEIVFIGKDRSVVTRGGDGKVNPKEKPGMA